MARGAIADSAPPSIEEGLALGEMGLIACLKEALDEDREHGAGGYKRKEGESSAHWSSARETAISPHLSSTGKVSRPVNG
jgi:hypothetical protein